METLTIGRKVLWGCGVVEKAKSQQHMQAESFPEKVQYFNKKSIFLS